ncbi:MAG: hypothetical protein WBW32_11755 [Luteibacter sp.]
MTARRKIYIALPERLLSMIERERLAAELRDGEPVTRDAVIEAMLDIVVEFAEGED